MSYYLKPDSHIRDKVKVVLDLSHYATKKGLDHTTNVDTSDLVVKKDFIALKADVDNLYLVKLVNVGTSLNKLKTKANDLHVSKLETVPVDLKKLSVIVDNEVVKNLKYNILKKEVNNLETEISDATTLIYTNQYNTGKQTLEKKYVDNKRISDTSGSVTTTVLNTKVREVETRIKDTKSLVITTFLNATIGELEYKISDHVKYITTPELNKSTAENFAPRLKQTNLVSQTYFDNKIISFNRNITSKYLDVKKNK